MPLAAGIINAGSIALFCAAVLLLFCGLFPRLRARMWHAWDDRRAWRVTKRVLLVLLCAGLLLCAVLSGLMLWSVADGPTGERTVVVLGAGINGDRPSRMLADRLKTAAEYLRAHPEAPCVVTGGQGADELYAESTVMKRYLIELGIEEDRIFEENKSKDTEQNLLFAREIIEREGLCPAVVVVTQEFHQYRAGEYAYAAGFEDAAALSCASPAYLLPCYWVREWFAILAQWFW